MRFDSAREAGLNEERIGRIADGYETALEPAEALSLPQNGTPLTPKEQPASRGAVSICSMEVAALKLTDAIIGIPGPPDEEIVQGLKAHFSDAEITELALGVGLFLGMSKVLINLGLEPEDMPVTVVPTPG